MSMPPHTAMVSDSTVNAVVQACLNGYIQKWTQGQMVAGWAMYMYIDVFKAISLLRLSLQDDGVDIIHGIDPINDIC